MSTAPLSSRLLPMSLFGASSSFVPGGVSGGSAHRWGCRSNAGPLGVLGRLLSFFSALGVVVEGGGFHGELEA